MEGDRHHKRVCLSSAFLPSMATMCDSCRTSGPPAAHSSAAHCAVAAAPCTWVLCCCVLLEGLRARRCVMLAAQAAHALGNLLLGCISRLWAPRLCGCGCFTMASAFHIPVWMRTPP